MKRVLVKSFAALFVLLYVVSCANNPVIEKPVGVPPSVEEENPEVIVPPEEEKPSDPTNDVDKPYIKVGTSELVEIRNDNEPYFTEIEYLKAADGYFMELSSLDALGRVGSNWGCFDYSHMPTEDRTSLSTNPTGWVQKKYEIVSGGWLYNRSHIIGFQISGLNDEAKNLMTGTRAFNASEESMLTYENLTAGHMRENHEHHVLYRVTPEFGDDNLLAYGVLMESDCLECDESADYCVFVYNMQPGITIDYRTGESWLSGAVVDVPETSTGEPTFILNTGTKKFHLLTCSRAPEKDSANYELTTKTRDSVIADGYTPCGICKP